MLSAIKILSFPKAQLSSLNYLNIDKQMKSTGNLLKMNVNTVKFKCYKLGLYSQPICAYFCKQRQAVQLYKHSVVFKKENKEWGEGMPQTNVKRKKMKLPDTVMKDFDKKSKNPKTIPKSSKHRGNGSRLVK